MPSTSKDFAYFRDRLIGMTVSEVRRGHGSALLLELGALSEEGDGEASLMIEWSWRIEHGARIACGSWSDEALWPGAFEDLVGRAVTEVALFGALPEVCLSLAGGVRLLSFMTSDGNPEWNLILRGDKDDAWLSVQDGQIISHDGSLIRD